MVKVSLDKNLRVYQGDILGNVELLQSFIMSQNGEIEIRKIVFPKVIVLSQDCDLEQDYSNRQAIVGNNDKYILSIIVAPIYNFDHVIAGSHLEGLNLNMIQFPNKSTSTERNYLNNNSIPRYHFLEFAESTQLVNSIIDFKHFFTVNREYIYEVKQHSFICKIEELYREDIQLRFANYLSRIGLPN